MNKLKRIIVGTLAVALTLGMAGCKKSSKLSHATLKNAAKSCGAEVVEDSDSFARIANQLYGYSVLISEKGDEAQSTTESMPKVKEFSIFMSAPDEYCFCYFTMVTFDKEEDADEFYKINCSSVQGNIIGNDGYSYNLRYTVSDDSSIDQACTYQKGKIVIFALSGNPGSIQFNDLDTICQELGIKSPSSVAKKMPKT